jgi:predicted metalloprotease with PDZ domain
VAARASRELTFGLERFEPGTTRLLAVPEGSPAGSAGVKPGDTIRAVDGLPVIDTVMLQDAMERSYVRPAYKLEGMEVTYERAGVEAHVRLFAAPQVVPILVDAHEVRVEHPLP